MFIEAGENQNYLLSPALDTSDKTSLTLSFRYPIGSIDANDNVRLQA